MELNDEIRAKISNAASMDEVVRICAEAGIPVTKEQLEASDNTTGAEGELSEEALDAVSGGSLIGLIWLLYRRRRNNRGQINGSGGGGVSAW